MIEKSGFSGEPSARNLTLPLSFWPILVMKARESVLDLNDFGPPFNSSSVSGASLNMATSTPSPAGGSISSPVAKTQEPQTLPARNIPLAQSENEKARELVTLDEKFLRDVAHMPPSAASYIRRHGCLTPEMMEKWRVGVLPQDGGTDKRGWSLRGQVLYPVLSEDGKLLAWTARDPQFETKEQAFNALHPEERAKEKKPAKHRFPADFHRGQELFG